MIIKKLDNGITVIGDYMPHAKSAAIGFFVKAGSVDEDSSNYGISHIIEHMMFKGTKTRSTYDISEAFDVLGADFNAFTSEEYTCYYGKFLPENVIAGAELFIDMITNSVFDADELEKEKQVILEELKMYEDNPDYKAIMELNKAIHYGTSFGMDIIGTEDSIINTTREKILDYYNKHYCIENMVVSVSGNFDFDAIYDYLNKNFAMNHSTVNRVLELRHCLPQYLSVVRDIEQSHIAIGCVGLGESHKDIRALDLLSDILGGTMSSRLFKSIREEQGLAYSVWAGVDTAIDTGSFSIGAGVAHENVEQTIKSIQAEIIKLKDEGITYEEFERAKNCMKSKYVFKMEGVSNRLRELGSFELLMSKHEELDEEIKKIDAITYEDVVKAIDYISDLSRYSYVVVSNKWYDIEKIIK